MDYSWLPELLKLAEHNDAFGPKISLEHDSLEFIDKNANDKVLKNILIIGGGSCARELHILLNSALNIDESASFTCIDYFEPTYFNSFSHSYSIRWIKEPISYCNVPDMRLNFDAVICLGTGRYMHKCSQIYSQLIDLCCSESLIIFDFMLQSSSLKSFLSHWHKYFSDYWFIDKHDVLKSLDDLAVISVLLGERLVNLDLKISSSFSPFSSPFAASTLQSLLFDYIFPFWYKPGADISQTRSLIIWYLCVICSYASFDDIKSIIHDYPLKVYTLDNKFSANTYVLSALKL